MSNKAYGNLKVKSSKSGGVVIEGYANKAVVDRGNDLIPPDAWELDEYKRNPIVFFNHDRNIPIGKALDVKVTPEGLKVRAEISKSDAAPIPFIRDMIKERVLRTFSVGFDPMDSVEKREDGVNLIKKANLLEFSVVSIPMNQESDFELVKKLPTWKNKSYDEAVSDILLHRGCKAAGELHRIISLAQNKVVGFDKKESLSKVAKLSNLSLKEVSDILNGLTPISEKFLESFSKVFVVPTDFLFFLTNEESNMSEKEKAVAEDEDLKVLSLLLKECEEDEEEDKGKNPEEYEEESEKEEEEEEEMPEDEEKTSELPGVVKLLVSEGVDEDLSKSLYQLVEKYDYLENKSAIYACLLLNDLIVNNKQDKEEAIASAYLLSDFVDIKSFLDEIASVIAQSLEAEDSEEEKQAEQEEGEPSPTVPVSDKTEDETEFGNPHLTVAKSQLALSGSMVSELKSINSIMGEVKQLLIDFLESQKSKAPMPSDQDEAEEEAEEVQDEDKDGEEKRLRMVRLDRKRQLIQNFKKRIDSL